MVYTQRDEKSADCPNQRVEQCGPETKSFVRSKRADRVGGCPPARLKHVEQGGFGDLPARSQSNGWGTHGVLLTVVQASGSREGRLGGHRDTVYRAVHRVSSANPGSVRFVAAAVPFVANAVRVLAAIPLNPAIQHFFFSCLQLAQPLLCSLAKDR